MAQQFHNVNLKAVKVPMLSENMGRTVMSADRQNAAATEQDDKPQVMYCENVLPTLEGMASVHLLEVIPAAVGNDPVLNPFVDARVIFGSKMSRLYLSVTANGTYWVLNQDNISAPFWELSGWAAVDPYDKELLTIGTVDGVSYLYYPGTDVAVYDEDLGQFVAVTLTGINMDNFLGLTASSGYLIAYAAKSIAWSSLIDPTDFTPSQETGSGGGNVADIDGDILFATPNTLGIVLYTEANAVAATYTGNKQYPFKFREVPSSKGGIGLDTIGYEANNDPQYVFTKAGFQTISSARAETVLPEVTDFLTGRRFETYDPATFKLTQQNLLPQEEMLKKVKYINSRYLCISHGIDAFTHTIVYDTSLSRMGKIVVDHTDVFEYIGDQKEIAKQSMTFLQADGACQFAYFSPRAPADVDFPGVLILARLQATHTRTMTLLGVDVTNVSKFVENEVFYAVDLPALDGFDDSDSQVPVLGKSLYIGGNIRRYGFRTTALNHQLILQGKFRATTALVKYTINGRR